jgi:Tfp pilus assembly protein PilW
MLKRPPTHSGHVAIAEDGFTLVELLVTMVAGVVVLIALFTVFDVTVRQTSSVVSRVDATQRARPVLEGIENDLHSSCVGGSATPIRAGSDATHLTYISQYSSAATVLPVQHTVTFTPNGTQGTLTESIYANTGGAPNGPFASTPSSTQSLLTKVEQQGTVPMFQYFAFTNPTDASGNQYLDPTGVPYDMLLDSSTTTLPSGATTSGGASVAAGTVPANAPAPLAVPLSNIDAANTAEVLINFVVHAGSSRDVNDKLSGIANPVQDAVVLRLTPVANHGAATDTVPPCA